MDTVREARPAEIDFLTGRFPVHFSYSPGYRLFRGAIREVYGDAEDFLAQNLQLTEAARVEDTPGRLVGMPILSL
jgi:hypothetical protein